MIDNLLVAACPLHVDAQRIGAGREEMRSIRNETCGTQHLQRRCIFALIGGIVYRAYLIIYILLVDIHRHSIYIARLGQLTLIEQDEGVGGIVRKEYFIILDVEIERIGLPGQRNGSVFDARLCLEVAHRRRSLHVLYLNHSRQRIGYILRRVIGCHDNHTRAVARHVAGKERIAGWEHLGGKLSPLLTGDMLVVIHRHETDEVILERVLFEMERSHHLLGKVCTVLAINLDKHQFGCPWSLHVGNVCSVDG